MRIEDLLQRRLGRDLVGIHLARLRLVFAATYALVRGGKATLTCIGRAIATRTAHKHGIKRADRLLGNEHLKKDRLQFFRAIARRMIAPASRPVVLVDWTDFSTKLWSLVAAVSFEGRAIVIYSETHPVSKYLQPAINRAFLKKLSQVLPEGCRPIIVTDAGFRSPWMREVSILGWDYICRLRGLNRLREPGRTGWSKLIYLFERMGKGAHEFGMCELGLRARFQARVVGFSKRRRRSDWREKWGKLSRSDDNKQLRSAREPWVLATSLHYSPEKVTALYRRRMQIEETFRDAKSPYLGLAMENARTKTAARVDVLMLLASLAHLLLTILGLVADAHALTRTFQANTIRNRRVFSLCRLGRLLLDSDAMRRLPQAAIAVAWDAFSERFTTNCEAI
jgi:Transposase DDE domain